MHLPAVTVRSQLLGRQRGKHLVHVHVGRGAGAGLEHVDRELVDVAALDDLGGPGDDGVGHRLVDARHAEIGVDRRGRRLDVGQPLDHQRRDGLARHREVHDRPLGLCLPLGA